MFKLPIASLNIFKSFCILKRHTSYILGTQVTMLSNGIKVATEVMNSPLVCVSLYISTGSRFESVGCNGITHFVEHLSFKGFNSMNKQIIDQLIAETGVKLTARTTREYQYFSAVCLVEHVKQILCLFSKIVLIDHTFCDVEAAKEKIQSQAIDYENNPKAVVFDYLHQTAFQGTTLGQSVVGPTCNLKKFDASCVSCYIRENYQPFRVVIASAGGATHEDMCCLTNSMFCYTSGPCDTIELNFGPQRYTGSQITYRDDSMPYAHVAIAVEAPGYFQQDYFTLYVANFIMGTWDKSCGRGEGNASYIARASAVGGVSVKFKPFYFAYRDVGLWGMYYASDKLEVDEMLLHVQDRWMNLCFTVTKNDVERAVNSARYTLTKKYVSIVKACNDIGKQVTYTSKRTTLENLNQKLLAITPGKIKEVANKYIYDKCPAVAAVGPTEVLTDYTRIRAGMYWLRL